MNKYTKEDLSNMQKWSLERKIQVTQTRIMEWVIHYNGDVYISFSGGKDSTVLLDLTCRLYKANPEIWCNKPLVVAFVNTGLEYPEIQRFVKDYVEWAKNTYDINIQLEILYPKMNFRQVIEKFGYPVISKRVAGYVSSTRKNPNCVRAKYLDGTIKSQFYSQSNINSLI